MWAYEGGESARRDVIPRGRGCPLRSLGWGRMRRMRRCWGPSLDLIDHRHQEIVAVADDADGSGGEFAIMNSMKEWLWKLCCPADRILWLFDFRSSEAS